VGAFPCLEKKKKKAARKTTAPKRDIGNRNGGKEGKLVKECKNWDFEKKHFVTSPPEERGANGPQRKKKPGRQAQLTKKGTTEVQEK